MASRISSTTPVSGVRLSFDPIKGVVSSVGWTTDEDPPVSGLVRLNEGYPDENTDDYDTLEVLQEIYADGFQDANGTDITPTLRGNPYFITLDNIEEYGYPHPLISGSWQRWLELQKFLGLATLGAMETAVEGGRRQLKLSADIVGENAQPTTENYDYPLKKWRVHELSADELSFEILIPFNDEVSNVGNAIGEYREVLALLAYLESVRETGSAVGSDLSTSSAITTSLGNRQFEIQQETDDANPLKFTYNTRGFGLRDSKYTEFTLRFDRVTANSAEINLNALQRIMQDTTVSLSSADIEVPPKIGSYLAELQAELWAIDDVRSLRAIHDTLLYKGQVPGSDKPYYIPLGSGWGISPDYTELPIVNSKRVIPFYTQLRAVHFKETSDGLIQILNPSLTVNYPGTDRLIAVHNVSADSQVEIEDEDDDNLITLYPGEYAPFLITLEDGGAKGEILGLPGLPHRELSYHETTGGAFGLQMHNQPYWTSSGIRYRAIRLDTSPGVTLHSDAYEDYSSTTPPTGDQGALNDADPEDFEFRGFFKILKDGDLEIEWDIQMRTDDDTTGVVSDYHYLGVYRIPADGSNPVRLEDDAQEELAGQGSTESFKISTKTRKVYAGDMIGAFYIYYTSGTTINFNNLRLIDTRIVLKLRTKIKKEWTA